MKDSQLIELIKSLSEKETEGIKVFLDSPANNNSPTIIKLFSILLSHYPLFSLSNYSKKKVFSLLIPGERYNNLLLNEYYHLLSNLIIEFLKKELLNKNKIQTDIELLNEFRRRGLKKQYDKLYKKVEAKLNHSKYDHSVLSSYFSLQETKINSRNAFGPEKRTMKDINEDYNLYLTYLINIVVSEYLSLMLIHTNEAHTFVGEGEDLFMKMQKESIIQKLYSNIKGINPFDFNIQLHFSLMEMLTETQNKEKYYQNKKILIDNFDKFTKIKLDNQINYLKSYCIQKAYSPDTRKEFMKEYIDLEFLIIKEKLFENEETNFLKNISFRNLLMMLSDLKEIEKIEELIHYSKYLHPDTRNDYKYLAVAFYNYHCSNNIEAERILRKIITGEKQLSLDADLLQLKIYFEDKNILKGIDKINSLRRLINYDKEIHKDRKNKYRIFLNYLEKLFRKTEKKDLDGVNILLEEILHKENIIFYEWFEERYENLKFS